MRSGSHIKLFLFIGLVGVAFIAALMLIFGFDWDQAHLIVMEIFTIGFVLMQVTMTYFVLLVTYERHVYCLLFLLALGLTAIAIYWGVTAMGFSARQARFILWGIIVAAMLGLTYLIAYLAPKTPDIQKTDIDDGSG